MRFLSEYVSPSANFRMHSLIQHYCIIFEKSTGIKADLLVIVILTGQENIKKSVLMRLKLY